MRAPIATRLVFAFLACLPLSSARADRAVPVWFDAAWHYRVPLTIAAGAAVNSTVVANVDFASLLTQMGISGTIDERSPRVVRPGGVTATVQEYNERVYNGVLDAANNGRGEVRFLLQDAPATGVYYLYFDITANGAKAANAATPINATFEQSAGSTPTSWVVSTLNAGGAQNAEVYRTASGRDDRDRRGLRTGAQSVDSSPARSGAAATGEAWMLLGYRDRCEDGNGEERVRLSRDIAVPAGAAAGALTFNFQVQGWDGISNATNYDWVIVSVNGTAVNHTTLGIANATTPQLVIDAGRIGRNAVQHDLSRPRLEAGDAEFVGLRRYHDQLPDRNPPHLVRQRLPVVGEDRRCGVERPDRQRWHAAGLRRKRDLAQRYGGGERFFANGRAEAAGARAARRHRIRR